MPELGMSIGCCCGCVIFDIHPQLQTEDETLKQIAKWTEDEGITFDAAKIFIAPNTILQSVKRILPAESYFIELYGWDGTNEFKVSALTGDATGDIIWENIAEDFESENIRDSPYLGFENVGPDQTQPLEWLKHVFPYKMTLDCRNDEASNAVESRLEGALLFQLSVFRDFIQSHLGSSPNSLVALNGSLVLDDAQIGANSITRRRKVATKSYLKLENPTEGELQFRRIRAVKMDGGTTLLPLASERCETNPIFNRPHKLFAPLSIDFDADGQSGFNFTSGAESRATAFQEIQFGDLSLYSQQEYVNLRGPFMVDTGSPTTTYCYYLADRQRTFGGSKTVEYGHYYQVKLEPLYVSGDDVVMRATLSMSYLPAPSNQVYTDTPVLNVQVKRYVIGAFGGWYEETPGGLVYFGPAPPAELSDALPLPTFSIETWVSSPAGGTQEQLSPLSYQLDPRWIFHASGFSTPGVTQVGVDSRSTGAVITFKVPQWDPGKFSTIRLYTNVEDGESRDGVEYISTSITSNGDKTASITVVGSGSTITRTVEIDEDPLPEYFDILHRGAFLNEPDE